jgi:hypothetical protein
VIVSGWKRSTPSGADGADAGSAFDRAATEALDRYGAEFHGFLIGEISDQR